MIILQDEEAALVIERLFVLEQKHKEFQDTDKYGRTLAEKLELQLEHGRGREF